MLCDELIINGVVPLSGMNIGVLVPRIKAAQKFVLGPEFAAVADALSTDYTGLVRAFPHCRLPFPETWIEVAQNDRPEFCKAPLHSEQFQSKPNRVGYLLSATRPDLSAWKAHMFWSTNDGCSCAAMAFDFDMTSELVAVHKIPTEAEDDEVRAKFYLIKPDNPRHPGWLYASDSVKQAILQHTRPALTEYLPPIPMVGIPWDRLGTFYGVVAELARSDWSGEPAYLLAVIGLLNARNAVEMVNIDHHKLNRARIKRGKPPLFTHKVLKITHRRMTRPGGTDAERGNYTPMRQHFCRGHFKSRATGVFFWHPHLRGDPKRGKIEKDYELT